MRAGRPIRSLLLLAVAATAFDRPFVSTGIGLGWFVSPLPSGSENPGSRGISLLPASSTNFGFRGGLLVDAAAEEVLACGWSAGLWEIAARSGGDISPSPGDAAREEIWTSTTALVLGRDWIFPSGTLSLSAGPGAFHLLDRVEHQGGVLAMEGWAPAAVAQLCWRTPPVGPVRFRGRMGWSWARTDLPLRGNPGSRLVSDWSRLEWTLGAGL